MMSTIVDLFMISVIISFIIDLSGIVDSFKRLIVVKLLKFNNANISLKPFDCSLCMTFWVGLAYLIAFKSFTLPFILVVCLMAYMADITTLILMAVKDLIGKIINSMLEYANKA